MSTKPIEEFFPAVTDIMTPANDDSAKKRARSDGSSSSSSGSPATKRTIFDGEEHTFELPDDAPCWVTMIVKSMDTMTQKLNDMSCKFDDISAKFDNYTRDVDARITEFTNDVT